ncbi:MAG: helix-turn-helix transcriptional regulator, partial [Clostridia bacterium]|nr:helix-turn-helix transcriptional regulator [Clostridia bacterium]
RVNKTIRPDGRGDYQLLYISSGCAHFYFDGKDRIVQKGNMVLYRPYETQLYNYDSADKPESYWVHFTGSEVPRILDSFGLTKNENVFFTGISLDYEWYFRQMISELRLKRIGYEEFLNMDLRHIFLTINRYIRENNDVGVGMLDEIERAVNYFNEHYNQQIVIEEYAKGRAMTANWFTQNFRKITRLTPMQYILSLRITNAKDLIDNTDYNMTKVAELVGYDDSMYFSRVFKKHTGMTPTEYKKRNTKQNK